MLYHDQNNTLLKDSFNPPIGLKNRHMQTILSSMGPRKLKTNRHLLALESKQKDYVLDCGKGIRLAGALNIAGKKPSKKVAILIHGWEGSIKSSYVVSMATHLLSNGIDVFRLNLRDHGDTHHLNEKIFNSTMVDEVIGAIEDFQRREQYLQHYLIGFSLGGNFSLRVAAYAKGRDLSLDSVIVFCPVVHAKASCEVLNESKNWVYSQYFVRKWKRSLVKKLEHYPHYQYKSDLEGMKTLDQMNKQLIPAYTEFSDIDDYFDAYAVAGDRLADTICPCYLHFSKDDMIIPIDGVKELNKLDNLNIMITEYGGHCGYISNWYFDSWQDQRALEIISA